jgi:hypothetical protein
MSWERGRPTGRCAVCGHAERTRIELLLAGGAGQKAVGDKYGLSKDSIHRHWHGHVSEERRLNLVMGPVGRMELSARVAEENSSVLDHLKAVRAGIYQQYHAALEAGDRNSGALLAGKLHENLRITARITGELATSPLIQNNSLTVIQSPEMQGLLDEIVNALAPWPEALEALGVWLDSRQAPQRPELPALEHTPT